MPCARLGRTKVSNFRTAMATVGQDIFKPTKFGGRYTVTLIPGMQQTAPSTVT